MNATYIVNCAIVLQGRQQGSFPYKIFFGLHFRNWVYDTNALTRYNPNITDPAYITAYNNIMAACGPNCPTGCMQVIILIYVLY